MPPTFAAARMTSPGRAPAKKSRTAARSARSTSECVLVSRLSYPARCNSRTMAPPARPRCPAIKTPSLVCILIGGWYLKRFRATKPGRKGESALLAGCRPSHERDFVIIERPFAHEADALGSNTVDDQLGIVRRAQIPPQQGVRLP